MSPNTEFVETPADPILPEVSLSDELATEAVPSLVDFADEIGGPFAPGWYKASIIEGYATRKGHQFTTEDKPSKNGDSRNLVLCFKISPKTGDPRNLQVQINYRTSDFSAERLAYIKEVRAEMKGVKGRWPNSDDQRTSLAIATLGQIEKALGFGFKRTQAGTIVPAPLLGQTLDVRLKVDEQGYNDVTGYAQLGQFTDPSKAKGNAKSA